MRRARAWLAATLVAAASVSAGLPVLRAAAALQLVDVGERMGVRFTHYTGAFGKKYLPEALGAGAAFLDIDGDGWQDLLLVNGADWPGHNAQPRATARLFRNDRGVRFVDVTAGSGLDVPMYGMGAAAADYDNDGRQDVLITAVGQSRLYRNAGGGKFVDVTDKAGLGGRSAFSTSALWADYDRDGRLDLLVANYVRWTPETDVFCSTDGKTKAYCTPEAYRGTTLWLFRNLGDGSFRDVTATAGLLDPTSKALGVTMIDYDLDDWPDLFVANDTQPNKLYRNRRDGTFVETGLQAGLAFSQDGRARAGMGVDAADYDNSGAPSFVVSNFSGEMVGLYRPVGRGLFEDRAPASEVGQASRHTLGFGCFFFDADLDGLLDLFVVNGHIDDTLVEGKGRVRYAETPHLFHNRGAGRLVDIAPDIGGAFAEPKVGRGAAYADIDLDGDPDVLVTTNGGPAHLYRNDLGLTHGAVRVTLQGTRTNRDGIGARIRARVGTMRLTRDVRTGSSYLSQSELPVTIGLGSAKQADEVVVEWPSGTRDAVGALATGRSYVITEGRGITSQQPLERAAAPR
jgi:hypothetical protein